LTVCFTTCLTACLAACAINPEIDLAAHDPGGEPRVTLAAPFFPQTEYQCGPAALATLLVHSGVDTNPDALSPQVYLPGRQGSLQIELVAATRRHGRIPFILPPDVDALLAELRAGRPVLLLQNLGTRSTPVWHYAVLTGYDLERNGFLLNSGDVQGMQTPAPTLLRTWNWGGNWALVALPPGDFPATAADEDATRYLHSVADFEVVAGSAAAAVAWRAAAQKWPQHPEPLLALGNHAYAQGRLQDAAEWYTQGLQLKPGNVVLANNLAAVLGELGCARAGEAVLEPVAQGLQGDAAWRAAVNATLEELKTQAEADSADCEAVASKPRRR